MKQLLSVALMVLVTLVGILGVSGAADKEIQTVIKQLQDIQRTLSAISNAVSALQARENPTTGAVTELQASVNAGVQAKPKVYYLSKNSFDGGDAITACDTGFHMASVSEIQDPSNLQYANRSMSVYDSLVDDESLGPPLKLMGWVRSGVYPPSGFVYDCEDFRGKSDTQLGTTLALYDLPFNSDAGPLASTTTKGSYTTHYNCSHPEPVWCVEDPD